MFRRAQQNRRRRLLLHFFLEGDRMVDQVRDAVLEHIAPDLRDLGLEGISERVLGRPQPQQEERREPHHRQPAQQERQAAAQDEHQALRDEFLAMQVAAAWRQQ